MDGKKPPTIKPSEFSNDLIVRSEKILAEAREQLRVEEEKQRNTEKRNREYLAQLDKDSEERRKRSREFSAKLDEEWEEGSIQRREFQAKVHKLSMSALSLKEIELTEALAAKTKATEAPAANHKAKTGKAPQKAGRKTDDKITDRNKEIATLLASGKPLLEVAKILDAQRKYSVPGSWMIVEDDGTPYPVKNFEKAYYDPDLRKKLRGLAYDVGRARGRKVGLSD